MTKILEVENLVVEFKRPGIRSRPLRALDGVSLGIETGGTVGLVGESGSGKSTLGRAVLGLTAVSDGTVRFEGRDITRASRRERRRLAGAIQAVFQDPYNSLNPTLSIGQSLNEPLLIHGESKKSAIQQVRTALGRVGLPPDASERYPSNFSGGQRQRIAIARALLLTPRLLICDEPVSALDLSMQAQILNLLVDLRSEFSLSCLFISHDMAVVRYISQWVVVLYKGRVMEEGPVELVCGTPGHPYTRALLAAVPTPDPRTRSHRNPNSLRRGTAPVTQGAVAEDACPFADRCPYVIGRCRTERPFLALAPGGTQVACHRATEIVDSAPDVTPAVHERGGGGALQRNGLGS